MANLPIIDFSAFTRSGGTEEAKQNVAAQLRTACIDVGFFYAIGHGVDEELKREALQLSKDFFLGESQSNKEKIALSNNPASMRGYQRLAENITKGKRDWHEAIDAFAELAEDHPLRAEFSAEDPRAAVAFGKNQWPESPSLFSQRLRDYAAACKHSGRQIMQAMALSLGLEERFFEPFFEDSFWIMRCIHYPPRSTTPGREDVGAGCGVHTDYGFLTLVNQDSSPHALQVQRQDGEWVFAEPLQCSYFVCNIGDMLQAITGGLYRSTPHQVLTTDTDRISVPFFLEPAWNAIIRPLRLPGNTQEGQTEEKGVVYGDHLFAKLSTNFVLEPAARQ